MTVSRNAAARAPLVLSIALALLTCTRAFPVTLDASLPGPADPYCGKTCHGDTECNQDTGCMQCACDNGHPPPCSSGREKNLPGKCAPVDLKDCGGDPDGPQNLQRTPTNRSLPQYLMIGDSITGGMWPHINASFYGTVDAVHDPRNAGDSEEGVKCIVDWIGKEPKRWDVITFNFGCWDTAWNKGQGHPNIVLQDYKDNLSNFTKLLQARTRAHLIYFSTTPAPNITNCCPNGRGTLPNNTLPPGFVGVTDCPVVVEDYNRAAKEVMTELGVQWVDLYSVVEKRCGGRGYTSCVIQPQGGGKPWDPNACNVHFTDWAADPQDPKKKEYVGGWELIANVVVDSVRAAVKKQRENVAHNVLKDNEHPKIITVV